MNKGFQVRILHPLPKKSRGNFLCFFFLCCGFIPRFAVDSFFASLSLTQKLRLQRRAAGPTLPLVLYFLFSLHLLEIYIIMLHITLFQQSAVKEKHKRRVTK